MCVTLDYAKASLAALIANGEGEAFTQTLDVRNTPAGVDFLLGEVKRLCRKHGIAPGHVCFGGGDCGGFSNHFIYALNAAGCRVVGFNAQDAKDQRENDPASTDKLDLLGILKMRLDKGGVTRSIPLRVPRCPTPAEKSKAERIGSRQHALKSA